jgi:hypothetical protein
MFDENEHQQWVYIGANSGLPQIALLSLMFANFPWKYL